MSITMSKCVTATALIVWFQIIPLVVRWNARYENTIKMLHAFKTGHVEIKACL